MTESRLPTEVELAYEVMSCNAMRIAQEPLNAPHPCNYFRKWGSYHSYDYTIDGAPSERGIVHEARYVGRAPLVPELLSGCRKAPIMAVGINPNLPGWWVHQRGSMNPLFDDYRQYAHYFRYRAVDKLELSDADYLEYGGGPQDTPFSDFELRVPPDDHGERRIRLQVQPQKMYQTYQSLLDALNKSMGWDAQLVVGEDLSYANMVASPSAKWTTVPAPDDPTLPPMTDAERDGIVTECFRTRKYFLRQLFQSLPSVILIFSQSTANAFIGEMSECFTVGAPRPRESLKALMRREIRLRYGELPDGSTLEARVIFAPHATGDPRDFAVARRHVIAQLIDEAKAGRITYNPDTGHLRRPAGTCVFCPMLEIGPCDYVHELQPLSVAPRPRGDEEVARSAGRQAVAAAADERGHRHRSAGAPGLGCHRRHRRALARPAGLKRRSASQSDQIAGVGGRTRSATGRHRPLQGRQTVTSTRSNPLPTHGHGTTPRYRTPR